MFELFHRQVKQIDQELQSHEKEMFKFKDPIVSIER